MSLNTLKNLTGNIGLFYSCYRLSKFDWNVFPTIRNSKGADIFIVSRNCKTIGVQVKSISNQADVFLGSNYNDESVDYWIVLLNVRAKDFPDSYIIPTRDLVLGVDICEQGKNSSDFLIYHDTVQEGKKTTYYINNKFLRQGQHSYKEAWDSIGRCFK